MECQVGEWEGLLIASLSDDQKKKRVKANQMLSAKFLRVTSAAKKLLQI